jgi:hypothetical protein
MDQTCTSADTVVLHVGKFEPPAQRLAKVESAVTGWPQWVPAALIGYMALSPSSTAPAGVSSTWPAGFRRTIRATSA